MSKVVLTLLAAVLAAVVAARLMYSATATTDTEPIPQPWAQQAMEFVAWNGERWTAWIRGNKFELQPRAEGKWQRHTNVSLAFTDWKGEPWQAKVDGQQFLLAHRGNWKGRVERTNAVRYRDWQGHSQVRTVAQLRRE
ncbi:MAG TPA: hypothetical protein VGD45_33865 [Steroidobacter sp.]|uniref:hypothetical protein n=1 Tax=Steroidobacter sp. TaxID=1978227 RepID=UPI002ED8AEC4